MLTITVKASSVSNLTDARYFAAWHVEWLGFDLTTSGLERLSLPQVKEIKDWIEGPKIVGELEVLDIEQSQQIINFLALECIQVGMHTPVEYFNSLTVSTIIKEVIIEATTTYASLKQHLDIYFDYVDYFLIDFSKNTINWKSLKEGTGNLTWKELKEICSQYEVFLNLDYTSKNTTEIVETINPLGLVVKGGVEEKVGFKSFDELDEIFELLEEEV